MGHCPNCQSESVEGCGGGFDIDGDLASNKMMCLVCNAVWEDIYKLAGFRIVSVPK